MGVPDPEGKGEHAMRKHMDVQKAVHKGIQKNAKEKPKVAPHFFQIAA